jgi:hypothetical protein
MRGSGDERREKCMPGDEQGERHKEKIIVTLHDGTDYSPRRPTYPDECADVREVVAAAEIDESYLCWSRAKVDQGRSELISGKLQIRRK